MKAVYLKFASESLANQFLDNYSTINDGLRIPNEGYSIDVIGIIYNLTVNGDEVISTPIDGWHVNMLVPDDFQSIYQIQPTSPRRIFAGW